MIELQVALLSVLPVFALGWIGFRLGVKRAARSLGPILAAWFLGAAIVWTGFYRAWFWPIGLITPLALGLVVLCVSALSLRAIVRRRYPTPSSSSTGDTDRWIGASGGAMSGVMVAGAVWSVSGLLTALSFPAPDHRASVDMRPDRDRDATSSDNVREWLGRLTHTAHKGFVRHLPVVGPVSDEVEALSEIIAAPESAKREFSQRAGWDDLAELETAQAILRSKEIHRSLEAISDGHLLEIYSLQKNERIIAFFKEERVRELTRTFRPTTIVPRLRAIVAEQATTESSR